jgi:hypothetical protein
VHDTQRKFLQKLTTALHQELDLNLKSRPADAETLGNYMSWRCFKAGETILQRYFIPKTLLVYYV